MGFDTGSSKGGPKSDINVTPLVDVVLVLLIIFIVAMPVMMKDIEIVVPDVSEDEVQITDPQPGQLVLEYTEDGRLLLNAQEIPRVELAVKMRQRLETKREKIVFFDFHDSVKYGDAVQVLDTVKGAGATKLALKLKDEEGEGASPAAPTP